MGTTAMQNYRTRIVFDGQSLNTVPGDGTSPHPTYPDNDPYQSMPYAVAGILGNVGLAVPAISGTSWTTLATTVTTRLFPLVRRRAGKRDILFMQGGQSDMSAGDTGAIIHSDMASYADAARAVGFNIVIASTIPYWHPFGVAPPAEWETARNEANALIRSNPGNDWEAFVEFDRAPLTNPIDGVHYIPSPDSTHWTSYGAEIAAAFVAEVVEPYVLVEGGE